MIVISRIIAATYDCPRIVPTPPPCPTSTTTTISAIHTTPTFVYLSSKPTPSSEAIPDSITLHSPTHQTPSNLIPPDTMSTKTISASPESLEVVLITATPVEIYVTPTRPVNSNDNDHTLRSGDQSGLIAVVLVLAVVLLLLLAFFIAGLIIFTLSRKRNKLSAYTKILSSQRSVGKLKRYV